MTVQQPIASLDPTGAAAPLDDILAAAPESDRDQYLVLFTAPPGSPNAEALALLNVLGAQARNYVG